MGFASESAGTAMHAHGIMKKLSKKLVEKLGDMSWRTLCKKN